MANRPTLASVQQLIDDRIGYTPVDSEVARAEGLLAAASEKIRDEADPVTWLNDAGDAVVNVPEKVVQVCLDAAYRAFDNARALSQQTLGDSSKSWDRTGREGGEAVYLTRAEKRTVAKAAGVSSVGVATLVSPYSGDSLSGLEVSLDSV